jgi:hypothetical protein
MIKSKKSKKSFHGLIYCKIKIIKNIYSWQRTFLGDEFLEKLESKISK